MNPELGPIVREVVTEAGSALVMGAVGGGVLGLIVGLAVVAVLTLVGALRLPGRYGRFGSALLSLVVVGLPVVGGTVVGGAWQVRPAVEAALLDSELGAHTVRPMAGAVADAVLAAAAAVPGLDEPEAVARRNRYRTEGLPLDELDQSLAAWSAAASAGTIEQLQGQLDASLRGVVGPATAERLRVVVPQLALTLASGATGMPTDVWEARRVYAARDGVPERLSPEEIAAWALEWVVVPQVTAPLAGLTAAVAGAVVTLVGIGWALTLGIAFFARWAWSPEAAA